MNPLRLFVVGLVGFQIGCVGPHTPQFSPNVAAEPQPESVTEVAKPVPELQVIKVEQAELGDVELNEALKLTSEGRRSYLEGRYDNAERVLKDALLFYPFLPEARLLLAKVLLVRGAAGRDLATLKLAKLMLEMALAMQPDLEEATQLLELFRNELPITQ